MSGEKEFVDFEFQNSSNLRKTVQNSPVSAIRKSDNDGINDNNNDKIKSESNYNDTKISNTNTNNNNNTNNKNNNNNNKDLKSTFSDSESENEKLETYINKSYQDSTSIKNNKIEKPLTKTESLNSFDTGSSSLNIKYGHTTDNSVSQKSN